MKTFPVVTKKTQELFEKMYSEQNIKYYIPEICGYYGRACRKMNEQANTMICTSCTLAFFTAVLEAITEQCQEKEALGIQKLYYSDVHDIVAKLAKVNIKVKESYIERVLDFLVEESD